MTGPSPAVAAQQAESPRPMPMPIVGATLWYWPNIKEVSNTAGGTVLGGMHQVDHGQAIAQPLRMSVDYVHAPNKVNGTVTDHAGRRHVKFDVLIVHPDDPAPHDDHGYAEWPTRMPFRDFSLTG